MKFKNIVWCDSDFYMIQDIDLYWTLVVVVMNITVPLKTHNFLTKNYFWISEKDSFSYV